MLQTIRWKTALHTFLFIWHHCYNRIVGILCLSLHQGSMRVVLLGKEPKVMFISFGAKETNQRKHSPHQGLPSRGGCNRSSCRSYTNVSSTHQRVGMFLSTTLNAGRLTLVDCMSVGLDHPLGFAAYMSEASLKKGPAWFLSTTLNAGRFGCGSSITLIILPLLKHRGYKGRGAPFL